MMAESSNLSTADGSINTPGELSAGNCGVL